MEEALSLREADQQYTQYWRAKERLMEEGGKEWREMNIEDQRWRIAQELLRMNVSERLMNARLRYVGMSLADFEAPAASPDELAPIDGEDPLHFAGDRGVIVRSQ